MKKRRGRGEGSIIERPNGTWYAQISHTDAKGNRTRITVTAKTKSQVQKKLRERQTAIEKQGLAVTSEMTCEAFFAYWLRDVVAPSRSPSTFVAYDTKFRIWVLPILGRIPLSSVGPDEINTILRGVTDSGKSSGTRHLVRALLSSALTHAVERGLIASNPVGKTASVNLLHNRSITVYTEEQAVKFVEECKKHRLGILWETAIQTGLRIGELLALKRSDVNLKDGVIHVRRTQCLGVKQEILVRAPKTTAGVRAVAIGAILIESLKSHAAATAGIETEWFFSDQQGKMLTREAEPKAILKKIRKAVGVAGITPHALRHTHATLLLMAGINVKVVSERLGHSKVAITLGTYQHFLPSMQQGAALVMDGVFR